MASWTSHTVAAGIVGVDRISGSVEAHRTEAKLLKRPKNRVATEPGAFRNESHLCWGELSPTVWTDDRSPDFHAGFRNSHHLNSVLRLAAKFWQRIPLECCLIGYGVLRTELLRDRYENRSKMLPSRLGCDFLEFSPQFFRPLWISFRRE